MQPCKSFFSTGTGKKLWRSLTQSDAHGHNRARRFHRYNLVIGGRVRQCVLDRIILGWCFHDPTLEDPYHQDLTDDDGYQVFLEFLLMPTEHLWTTTPMALDWLRITGGFAIVFCIRQENLLINL